MELGKLLLEHPLSEFCVLKVSWPGAQKDSLFTAVGKENKRPVFFLNKELGVVDYLSGSVESEVKIRGVYPEKPSYPCFAFHTVPVDLETKEVKVTVENVSRYSEIIKERIETDATKKPKRSSLLRQGRMFLFEGDDDYGYIVLDKNDSDRLLIGRISKQFKPPFLFFGLFTVTFDKENEEICGKRIVPLGKIVIRDWVSSIGLE